MPDDQNKRQPFEIVPIKRVDVYESVLAQLNALITESGMEPGDRLPPERELVEKLGVSRVSVREALRALESMGKIEIRPNAGSFLVHPNGNALVNQLRAVAPVDRAFLGHLIDVRAAVEDRVVALVAGRSGADLSAVRVVLERSGTSLRESGEAGSLDLSFEAALAREAGNPLLAEVQRSVHHLLYIRQEEYHQQFAQDVPAEQTALMAVGQRPVRDVALNEGSGPPAWKSIPSWFVFGELDKNIPVAAHRFMAERAGLTSL